jgi:hypothetical protein
MYIIPYILYLILLLITNLFNLYRSFFELKVIIIWFGLIPPFVIIVCLIILLFITNYKNNKIKTILFIVSILLCMASIFTTKYQRSIGSNIYFYNYKKDFNLLLKEILDNKKIFQYENTTINNENYKEKFKSTINNQIQLRQKLEIIKSILDSQKINEESFWLIYEKMQKINIYGFQKYDTEIIFKKRGFIHAEYGYIYNLNEKPPSVPKKGKINYIISNIPNEKHWFYYHYDPDLFVFD